MKEEFDKLEVGREYGFLSERYGDGKLEFRRTSQIILKAKIVHLVTHDPERWQCTVWYSDVSEPDVQLF